MPFLSASVSDWLLLGSSNKVGASTWPIIFEFLEKHRKERGVIIFIDEIDKAYHDTHWNSFLRAEMFSLCDYRLPLGLNDSDNEVISSHRFKEVEDFLKYNTMIIAGAAFQGIWENQSAPQMGFVPSREEPAVPELCELAKHLPRELINRFSSEIFVLSKLTKHDYQIIIETMAEKIPDMWRSKFLELGISRLDQAVRDQKGARYAEEILLSAIVEERGCMANFITPDVQKLEESPGWLVNSLGMF